MTVRIAFVNLPWETEQEEGMRSGCRFPHLAIKRSNSYLPFPFLLAYAAAYAEANGAEVLCIDGVGERSTVGSVTDRLAAFASTLLVMEVSTASLEYDLAALTKVRDRLGSTATAVFGSHVDVRPQDGLACKAVDYVIHGEPELTSFELACAIAERQTIEELPGLSYRGPQGEHRQTPRRPVIEDLDALPYPKRQGLPMDRYHVPGFPAPTLFLYGSRGCPFKCTFCLWPQTIFRGKYRARSGNAIAAELHSVLQEFPETKSVFFDDDTFNLGRHRLVEFAVAMKERKIRIPWGMNARADNWDRELLEQLAETGLFNLRIGIESGDETVLARAQKGVTLETIRQTLELSDKLGIKNHVSFVIGLPGETERSVSKTIRFIRTLPVDSVQFSAATPFPGTSFYTNVEDQGLLETKDWSQYNGIDHPVSGSEEMSADEISIALRRARRQVYFMPRFVARRLSYIRSFRDLSAIARKASRLIVRR